MQQNGYAWITGATGGVGGAFAFALAKRGYSLVLTGRKEEKLSQLQQRLQAEYPNVQTVIVAADLTDVQQRQSLMKTAEDKGIKVRLLVNAAGVDIQKPFAEYTQEKIALQSRANFEAAASLCHFAHANRANRLEIINISSVSGIYPMPYFAVYSATKAALTSFSMAVREEWKKDNVAVTAVLPGAMPTREDIQAQIRGQGLWGRLAAKSPEWVAEYALKAVRKNKRKVIPGFWNKVMRLSTAWLPQSWRLKFIAKRWSKISKDAF